MQDTARKTAQALLLSLGLLLTLFGSISAQGSVDIKEIDAFIQERMESLDIPGASLAVVRGGEIAHLKGYGVSDESGRPLTPQTPFLLASFSKSMTAATDGFSSAWPSSTWHSLSTPCLFAYPTTSPACPW